MVMIEIKKKIVFTFTSKHSNLAKPDFGCWRLRQQINISSKRVAVAGAINLYYEFLLPIVRCIRG